MRLIDADAMTKRLKAWDTNDAIDKALYNFALSRVLEAPTVVPERKRGRWIYSEDEYGIDGYHCDKCGFFVPWDYAHKLINYIEDYHYCPNCGHPMGGESE